MLSTLVCVKRNVLTEKYIYQRNVDCAFARKGMKYP